MNTCQESKLLSVLLLAGAVCPGVAPHYASVSVRRTGDLYLVFFGQVFVLGKEHPQKLMVYPLGWLVNVTFEVDEKR